MVQLRQHGLRHPDILDDFRGFSIVIRSSLVHVITNNRTDLIQASWGTFFLQEFSGDIYPHFVMRVQSFSDVVKQRSNVDDPPITVVVEFIAKIHSHFSHALTVVKDETLLA